VSSDSLRVRRATVADAPTLARLIGDLGYATHPADLGARMRSLPEGHTVLVAERGAGVVGFVHVATDPSLLVEDRAQVAGIAVAPEHRGNGIGARLLEEAAVWAREHGCHHLWVRSGADRDDTHAFYRATGFEDVREQLTFLRDIEGAVDQVAPRDPAVVPVVVRTTPSI
jgi:GNAT superfamily N-acetyltransferase